MEEGRTDEPGDGPQMPQRLTVAQAAISLGITEGAVRSRVKRGTLPTVKEGGTVYVLWRSGTLEPNHETYTGEPPDQSELVESLQDQVAFLRAELERRGGEADRYQRIVGGLAQANANLSERVRELEAPASIAHEPRGEPQAPEHETSTETPASDTGQPRRSWWRRRFGF